MVPGACHDGVKVDMVLPGEAGEVEAPTVLEAALVQSVPAPVDEPKVW